MSVPSFSNPPAPTLIQGAGMLITREGNKITLSHTGSGGAAQPVIGAPVVNGTNGSFLTVDADGNLSQDITTIAWLVEQVNILLNGGGGVSNKVTLGGNSFTLGGNTVSLGGYLST